jgi:NAD(P)-dependent dehydrogenase (short-subunit alcohol dehydrogenase family)
MSIVFITGGARGIGYELARLYLDAGWRVIVGVRDLGAARERLPGAEAVALDVTDADSVAAAAAALAGTPLDVLVNNAGVIGPERQSSTDMDFDGFAQTLAVNTLGPLRVTSALLPMLRLAEGAKVIVVSSQMGALSQARSDHLAYRASKAAVNKVVQGLATDLAQEGIAVASVHPGWVRTEMGGSGADLEPIESARSVKAVIAGLDLSRTGRFFNYDGSRLAW